MRNNYRKQIIVFAPTPPPYAGPEVATAHLLQALPQDRIKFVHVRSNIRSANAAKGRFDLAGLRQFLRVYRELLRQLRRHRGAKVYFLLSLGKVGFLRDSVVVFTAKLLRRTTIAHYRGGLFRDYYQRQGALYRWFVRQVLHRLDCLIVQAECLRPLFAGLVPDARLRVLYNGLPLNGRLALAPARPEAPVTLLFIGHLAFSKGFYDLIVAYKALRRAYPVRLLFAGERRYAGAAGALTAVFLNESAKQFFITNQRDIESEIAHFVGNASGHNATYLGVVHGDAKAAAFNAADLLVLPSYTEGFSMAVLEAMAHGLPVVVTPVGALPEVVRDGTNGLLVEPGNPGDLHDKLARLVGDAALRRAMGTRNAAEVSERFALPRIATDFARILREA